MIARRALLTLCVIPSCRIRERREETVGSGVAPTATQSDSRSRVWRVIDGDTLELEDRRVIRLAGIDTPETKHPRKGMECFGREAHSALKSMVSGKEIVVTVEPNQVDRYGRVLAHLFAGGDHINLKLVELGYAKVYRPKRSTYWRELAEAEERAARAGLGLWGACAH